jgi:hypothetical protein
MVDTLGKVLVKTRVFILYKNFYFPLQSERVDRKPLEEGMIGDDWYLRRDLEKGHMAFLEKGGL